jgi:hypothetical protein
VNLWPEQTDAILATADFPRVFCGGYRKIEYLRYLSGTKRQDHKTARTMQAWQKRHSDYLILLNLNTFAFYLQKLHVHFPSQTW